MPSIRHLGGCALVLAAAVIASIPALSQPEPPAKPEAIPSSGPTASPGPTGSPGLPLGYNKSSGLSEQQLERQFRAAVLPDNIRQTMRHLSARPHHVGSPYDK